MEIAKDASRKNIETTAALELNVFQLLQEHKMCVSHLLLASIVLTERSLLLVTAVLPSQHVKEVADMG
jgi:hypothetical protein